MKRDIALRFAATVDELTTLDQVRSILREFFARLAVCPVCDDTGEVTLRNGVEVPVVVGGVGGAVPGWIEAGSTSLCPHCGGPNEDGSIRGDPDYVAWRCVLGTTEHDCQTLRQTDSGSARIAHSDCGYQIMLRIWDTG